MINFKKLFETVYPPKPEDEKNFMDKHIVHKTTEPGVAPGQFTSDKKKVKRKADYDTKEDEAVYEAAAVHTKRADKEAVIVRAVDPKTGESKARVVQRRAGEIKIGEEVEQIDELSDDKLRDYHAKAGTDRLKAKAEVEKGMKNLRPNAASVQKTADSYKRFIKRGRGMTAAANKMSEEVELDEAKLSASQRDRLDDLIHSVRTTTDPEYDGNDTPQKYLKAIEKEFGSTIAKQVDDGSYQMHFGRDNRSSGHDKLASRQWSSNFKGGPRVTAAGKMNKQDVSALKTRIKNDKKFGGLLKSVKLPEEVELEEGTVGHGKYTITTGPKISGMGEGGPAHVVAKRAKMAKLGVPHHDDPGEYGHTVKVTVKNNDTGETTHHHVYQRDTDRGSKEALVSTRTVGAARAKQKEHEKVLHNYLAGKKVSSLKEDLDEKVKNPYAVGMAAAMKATGDTPPLKKSTIVKGHEIAKSIKKEAMDLVGKHDADIDNDGDTDKSDKYLINRRKAIGKALRKEDLDEAVEVSHDRYMRSHGKKASGGEGSWMFTHKRMGDANTNDPKEVHTAPRGKLSDAKKSAQEWAKKHGHSTVYVMEEVEQIDEAPGKRVSSAYRMTVPLKDGQIHPDHAQKIDDLKAKVRADNAKEGTKNKVILQGRLGKDNPNASKYKSKFTGKSFPGSHQRIKLGDASHADVYVREEVEMIDEAVKVGAMKLHDGSLVNITRAMADTLNSVLEQLNPMNRVKMEQKLHTSKKDFDEILKFAENVNG